MSKATPRSTVVSHIAATALFAGLIAVAAVSYMTIFPQQQKPPPQPSATAPDQSAMRLAMSVDSVQKSYTAILDNGSRFCGQDGWQRTEAMIREAYKNAGLELYELQVSTPTPRTITRKVYTPAGQPLNIAIYPLLPNHMQPIATPPQGLSGKLLLVNDSLLRTMSSFSNCIAVLYNPPTEFGYDWKKYAQLGFKGVIVAHPKGLDSIPWDRVRDIGMLSTGQPVNYLRLVADKNIFSYLDSTVNFQVKVVWENTPNTVLIGRLAAPVKAHSAVVVSAPFDASGLLPDTAIGFLQALSTATQLSMLKGILPYRNQFTRDLFFVAYGTSFMAHDALCKLAGAVGIASNRDVTAQRQKMRLADNQQVLAAITNLREKIGDPLFAVSAERSTAIIASFKPDYKKIFDEQYRFIINTVLSEIQEVKLIKKIDFERIGGTDLASAQFAAYSTAKRSYDQAVSVAGFSLDRLLTTSPELAQTYNIHNRLIQRFNDLILHHTSQIRYNTQALALNNLFQNYQPVINLAPELIPEGNTQSAEVVSIAGGGWETFGRHMGVFADAMATSNQRLEQANRPDFTCSIKNQQNDQGNQADLFFVANAWGKNQLYPSVSIMNFGRFDSYRTSVYPIRQPHMEDLRSIKSSLQLTGQSLLDFAMGQGRFLDPSMRQAVSVAGEALAEDVGVSIIPNYPLPGALIAHTQAYPTNNKYDFPGHYRFHMAFADAYGAFDLADQNLFIADGDPSSVLSTEAMNIAAATYDTSGLISYFKNTRIPGRTGQKVTSAGSDSRITIRCFRASPVAVIDLINPQTLKPYSSIDFINRDGLAGVRKLTLLGSKEEGILVGFLEPEKHFFVELKAGSSQNELVQSIRAFMLGADSAARSNSQNSEINGTGYMAYDVPFLLDVANHTARSMAQVNRTRLNLQKRYHLADERTIDFQEKSEALLNKAATAGISLRDKILTSREAVTYAILNHPILRDRVFEAVVGILWYLALLIPFVFFMEKLLFCYADIRKQLLAMVVIFLTVFLLLRLLHPAFAMIRSSLMILLGFVIFLISAAITSIFSSKFSENFEELRKKQGKVTQADVSQGGVLSTAFMLGLNNMHRRKVRTWLTCATLVLITFAMICFTSINSDLVDRIIPIGKAAYQGFLVKNERFVSLTTDELFALQTKYGEQFTVVPRAFYVGQINSFTRERLPVTAALSFQKSASISNQIAFSTILELSYNEPLKSRISLLTSRPWFTANGPDSATGQIPILIPEKAADNLGITVDMVNRAPVAVRLNNTPFVVTGIFSSKSLNDLRDLDGRTLMPFDIDAMDRINAVNGQSPDVVATEADPVCKAEQTIISPYVEISRIINPGPRRIASATVVMNGLRYKEARSEVERYMEQTGKPVYYGLDGISYLGSRSRGMNFGGLIDMLIPLIIAALTVLNTLKGSVYERRDEIFIYNAVGIAPRYIAFMFFAEAFVYAVVGSVMGYLLSQGVGRVLTELNLTGGLNMTFASMTTIYASLAVGAAVFISTYFPARVAMKIAAPADNTGWELPQPVGDTLQFNLPFTFTRRDRIAILAFFNRYFIDHSEGSSGAFYSGQPRFGINDNLDKLDNDSYIPEICTQIWLKPFDLGVSQEIAITLLTDPETKEYIATISLYRVSGTVEAWHRLNHTFVALLRRHFLYWRAVPDGERQEMFVEAQSAITAALVPSETAEKTA